MALRTNNITGSAADRPRHPYTLSPMRPRKCPLRSPLTAAAIAPMVPMPDYGLKDPLVILSDIEEFTAFWASFYSDILARILAGGYRLTDGVTDTDFKAHLDKAEGHAVWLAWLLPLVEDWAWAETLVLRQLDAAIHDALCAVRRERARAGLVVGTGPATPDELAHPALERLVQSKAEKQAAYSMTDRCAWGLVELELANWSLRVIMQWVECA